MAAKRADRRILTDVQRSPQGSLLRSALTTEDDTAVLYLSWEVMFPYLSSCM